MSFHNDREINPTRKNITLVNTYTIKVGAPKHRKQLLTNIKADIDGKISIVRDFNITLISMIDHPNKINKEILALND